MRESQCSQYKPVCSTTSIHTLFKAFSELIRVCSRPGNTKQTFHIHPYCVCVCEVGGEEGEEMRCGMETIFSSV